MQIYDIAHDVWSYGAPVPAVGIKQNGLEVPACSVDAEQQFIYVFGGQDDHLNHTRNIYKYHIVRFVLVERDRVISEHRVHLILRPHSL